MKKSLTLIFIFVSCTLFLAPLYALNIDKVKVAYLSGDYKEAIKEGERLLAGAKYSDAELDKLYYIMGLSYMQDGNYLRACDIFEIILNEFRSSKLTEEALLGLGDTYFLRGNLVEADKTYNQLLSKYPSTVLKEQVYQRLAKIAFKSDDKTKAEDYLKRLRDDFGDSGLADNLDEGFCAIANKDPGLFYTVQVGCFTNKRNAERLMSKLSAKKYEVYIEETSSGGAQRMFRVRVGKFSGRRQAVVLEKELSRQGYPTKIYP